MGITNEFERDLNAQAGLKRVGRVDLVVLQNTADAGDGHPGLQRCFRNYLHEGGMEKDLDLVGYSIKGTSVNINNAELQQLSNIGATTIDATQWGYVGGADQPVKQADSPTFGGITVNGNIIITGNVDGVDISTWKTDYDAKINQSVQTGASPTFVSPIVTNLNLADDIIHVGDTDNLISFGTDTQDFQTGGATRLDLNNSGLRIGGANTRVTGIIDNDSLGILDTVLCTQGNVKAYVDNKLPIGFIAMFNGSWTDNSTIPGWYKCDGNNGTVNLVDKFVRGGATSGAEGGSDDAVVVQHNHTAGSTTGGVHQHTVTTTGAGTVTNVINASIVSSPSATLATSEVSGHTHPITVNNDGVSGTGKNMPTYYTLIFIQRIS